MAEQKDPIFVIKDIVEDVHQRLVAHVDDFRDHKKEEMRTMSQINIMHQNSLRANAHLKTIADVMLGIKEEILPVALNQKHVPLTTMEKTMETQAKNSNRVIYILLAVILMLMSFITGIVIKYPEMFAGMR